jgi:hypothetical protein
VAQIQALLQTAVSLRDRWLLSLAAQATVVLVGSRLQTAAWARLLGAADALGQAIGGATFGWEHLPGAEHVVILREQLGQEGEQSAAYRQGSDAAIREGGCSGADVARRKWPGLRPAPRRCGCYHLPAAGVTVHSG